MMRAPTGVKYSPISKKGDLPRMYKRSIVTFKDGTISLDKEATEIISKNFYQTDLQGHPKQGEQILEDVLKNQKSLQYNVFVNKDGQAIFMPQQGMPSYNFAIQNSAIQSVQNLEDAVKNQVGSHAFTYYSRWKEEDPYGYIALLLQTVKGTKTEKNVQASRQVMNILSGKEKLAINQLMGRFQAYEEQIPQLQSANYSKDEAGDIFLINYAMNQLSEKKDQVLKHALGNKDALPEYLDNVNLMLSQLSYLQPLFDQIDEKQKRQELLKNINVN